MIELASFVSGKWEKGNGKAAELVNPSTEEIVATTSTEGIDLGAALAFARERGGPALRAMTFAQRGEMLRAMSRAIHAQARRAHRARHRQRRQHARRDAKFDIDGAIGTLAAYADLARGARRHATSSPTATASSSAAARASSGSTCSCRATASRCTSTRSTSPRGASREKAACALLAGMPVDREAGDEHRARRAPHHGDLRRREVLPEGALSFVCGSPGDLLDHLGGRTCSRSRARASPRASSAAARASSHALGARERRGRQPQRRRARARTSSPART